MRHSAKTSELEESWNLELRNRPQKSEMMGGKNNSPKGVTPELVPGGSAGSSELVR